MRNRACAVLLTILAAACLALSPLKNAGAWSTAHQYPRLITSSDPSDCTVSKGNPAREIKGMSPLGPGKFAQDSFAWIFKVNCGSGEEAIEIR